MAGMTTEGESNDLDQIRALIDERVRAVRAKDVDAVLRGYAADVVTFDFIAPLSNRGVDTVRLRLTDWFSSFATPIDYELKDVTISVAGDVAFDHHVTHVRGASDGGAKVDMWFRETIGYRKIDGRWQATHQHSSSPVDMASGKAQFDLRP
jgi:uncharacterized protein (TIGR02246 family)